MSIIEQATRRLEELKRAGVEVAQPPSAQPSSSAPAQPSSAPAQPVPLHRGALPEPARGFAYGAAAAVEAAIQEAALQQAGPSSARDRAAGTVASGALVRAGLRQSRSVELDLAQLAEQGYLVPGAVRSTLADEFRAIKQPLLKNARTPAGIAHANLIMVTSAMAGEGKTFCALNLALSIASEVDSSVLLVDADVVRPAVLGRLGLHERCKGLLDLLSDTALELPDLILKTNVPKLSVLPAGAPSMHSTELLASDAMRELLADIASRYPERIVIFDAPPLLSTTESRVLAARMGQILMVVSAGQTSQIDLSQAFTALEHCPLVMCVLNRSSNDPEHRYYGYYAA
jgi:protein-tyrosine kinase